MKKINLSHIRIPDKKHFLSAQRTYGIFLGNEINISFPSEKKARKFLADTNRFLNIQLQELNQVYIQLFAEYRRLWFIIDFESNIEDAFHDITKFFKKIVSHGTGENSNVYIYLDFIRLTNELKNVIEKLIVFQRKINDFAGANILASLLLRVDNVNYLLNNYGS